jgi:hypothetical protein
MDVWQAEDGYHVALDVPGVDPDNSWLVSRSRPRKGSPKGSKRVTLI